MPHTVQAEGQRARWMRAAGIDGLAVRWEETRGRNSHSDGSDLMGSKTSAGAEMDEPLSRDADDCRGCVSSDWV